MALVVVATFMNLPEAQIAAGALEASGLHPSVADQHFGSLMWTEQFALQGFRVAVPESEVADASAFLAALRSRRIRRPRESAGAVVWRVLAVLLLFGLGGAAGWLPVAGLRRRRPGHTLGVMTTVAVFGAIGVGYVAVAVIVGLWPVMAPYYISVPTGVALIILTARQMRVLDDRIAEASSSSEADTD